MRKREWECVCLLTVLSAGARSSQCCWGHEAAGLWGILPSPSVTKADLERAQLGCSLQSPLSPATGVSVVAMAAAAANVSFSSSPFEFYLFVLCIWMFLQMYSWAPHVCLVSMEIRRRPRIPWSYLELHGL